MSEGLHSAAFSAADNVLAKRIRDLEQRLATIEARVTKLEASRVHDAVDRFRQSVFGLATTSGEPPQPPASAA